MHRTTAALALLFSPALAFGAEPAPHRARGDLALQARAILRDYCADCHTGSSDPGKSKLRLLDHKQLTAKDRKVPLVAREGRALLLDLVKDGSMPPANRRAPTRDDITVLENWVKDGAPGYPEQFDERFQLEAIADDLDSAKGAAQARRYVSFAHLITDGKLPNLADAERRLTDALERASGSKVTLEPIDPTATIFRLDLKSLGWQTRELFERMDGRVSLGPHPLKPFDLLLLEYPFGVLDAEDTVAKRLESFLASKNQLRSVPFIHGDWLASALVTDGKLTPLGEDLKSLALLEQALARSEKPPVGPPVPRILGGAPFDRPKSTDGRVPIPPLSGWYTGEVTPEPAPFELTAELVSNGQVVKGVKVSEAFQLRVNSNRRVFLTLLMVQADGEIVVQNLLGGSVLQARAQRELKPKSDRNPDGFKISGILTGGNATTEYFVLFASETELPLPQIVQSTHPDRPVSRFLLDPSAKERFDPNKVLRKVIPIPVTGK
jgi:hypothetical protein